MRFRNWKLLSMNKFKMMILSKQWPQQCNICTTDRLQFFCVTRTHVTFEQIMLSRVKKYSINISTMIYLTIEVNKINSFWLISKRCTSTLTLTFLWTNIPGKLTCLIKLSGKPHVSNDPTSPVHYLPVVKKNSVVKWQ